MVFFGKARLMDEHRFAQVGNQKLIFVDVALLSFIREAEGIYGHFVRGHGLCPFIVSYGAQRRRAPGSP
jgi:hypothetical protein